jgi:hypothetical protein
MNDYEIRDVMSRSQHPLISVECEVHREINGKFLKIKALNRSRRVAEYVVGSVLIPTGILDENQAQAYPVVTLHSDVTSMDVPHHEIKLKNFEPILPDLPVELLSRKVDFAAFAEGRSTGVTLRWQVHADAALKRSGETALRDIPVYDKTFK